jgi:hypothetical protein
MYETGDTPWDIGKPDFNLIQAVTSTPIRSCKALELGCGTGDNAIWLSQQKFQVLGQVDGTRNRSLRDEAVRGTFGPSEMSKRKF